MCSLICTELILGWKQRGNSLFQRGLHANSENQ
jgi:hypothetical protein